MRIDALFRSCVRVLGWRFLKVLVKGRFIGLVAALFGWVIEERQSGGAIRAGRAKSGDDRITLLALSPDYFRGDLDAFVATRRVRVLQIQERWLTRLLYQFYPRDVQLRSKAWRFMNPDPTQITYAARQEYRSFLEALLPKLLSKFRVDCIISHHINYLPDIDWGSVSNSLGTPYVVLFREGFLSHSQREHIRDRLERAGRYRFEGTHVVVHNEAMRQLLIGVGFAQSNRISSLGVVRMDEFLKRIASSQNATTSAKRVVLFPFIVHEKDVDWFYPVFRDTHIAFAELAVERPDLQFIIKPKGPQRLFEVWKRTADPAFAAAGIDPYTLPNMTIRHDLDVQDLILNSAVICGHQSTTVLEAGIAGKPVIICHFKSIRDPRYKEHIRLADQLDCYELADDGQHLKELILDNLEHPIVASEFVERRRHAFSIHVSNIEGNATRQYLDLFERLSSRRSAAETMGRSSELPNQVTGLEGERNSVS